MFCCCGREPEPEPRTDKYGTDSIRRLAAFDLDAAFQRVDEGEQNGELSAFDAATYRAKLAYHYTENHQLAIDYCRQALAALDSEEDGEQLVETYYLLATIAEYGKEFLDCIDACTDGKEIAHDLRMRFVEYSFDYMVGKCLFDLQLDDGLQLMQSSIDKAKRVVKSDSDYGHLLFFIGNLINCYIAEEDMTSVLREAENMELLVDKMQAKFPRTRAYCEQCRYDLYMARAIANAHLGNGTEAETYFNKALTFDYYKTFSSFRTQIIYYATAGNVDSVLSFMDRYPYQDADTVKRLYRQKLFRLEQVYRVSGDTATAQQYQQRIDTLSKLISRKEQQEGTALNAIKYEARQYKLDLDDLSRNTKRTIIVLFLAVIFMFLVFLVFYRFHKKRASKSSDELKQKTQSMEQELSKIQKQVHIIVRENSQGSPAPSQEVKRSLAALVEEQQLFLNKDISRSLIAQMMGCSHKTMTKMLNEIHPGLSFPDYIKGLRIAYALNLIKETPGLSVQQIADQSGFYSISSFERSFKSITGKTPRDYMKTTSS
ncbi:MAG: AraC family transcriptional regulator [Bacteroidales bacterium]|nr:AraC family transcriptional regulator [Bacteroidales bacterium]